MLTPSAALALHTFIIALKVLFLKSSCQFVCFTDCSYWHDDVKHKSFNAILFELHILIRRYEIKRIKQWGFTHEMFDFSSDIWNNNFFYDMLMFIILLKFVRTIKAEWDACDNYKERFKNKISIAHVFFYYHIQLLILLKKQYKW